MPCDNGVKISPYIVRPVYIFSTREGEKKTDFINGLIFYTPKYHKNIMFAVVLWLDEAEKEYMIFKY